MIFPQNHQEGLHFNSHRHISVHACILYVFREDELHIAAENVSNNIGNDSNNTYSDNIDILLCPHGQQYEEIDGISIDPSANHRYIRSSYITWPNEDLLRDGPGEERSFISYFYLCFPMNFIQNMLEWTNFEISRSNYPESCRAPVSKGELIKWLGIRLTMVVYPRRGGLPTYFATDSIPGSNFEPGNYGKRFQMSKNRFEIIQKCLRFGPPTDPKVNGQEVNTQIIYIIRYEILNSIL